ncbi:hypothetical protein LP415_08330 [Polaromonas sp. P1(28)-8]|nr:hypothetical protein LP415_08330 [Polaromonas sp. P1(28)-8]
MLANRNAMATIAVRDIDVAHKFYGGTLGLQPLESSEKACSATRAAALP